MEKYQLLGRRISFAPFSKHQYMYLRWKPKFQARPVHFPATCPMATGPVRCRRFQSLAPPSWTRKHSHIRVSLATNIESTKSSYFLAWKPEEGKSVIWSNLFPALQCRLECEPGYVAQRTPLITCVNGEYAKGCHYSLRLPQLKIWRDVRVVS